MDENFNSKKSLNEWDSNMDENLNSKKSLNELDSKMDENFNSKKSLNELDSKMDENFNSKKNLNELDENFNSKKSLNELDSKMDENLNSKKSLNELDSKMDENFNSKKSLNELDYYSKMDEKNQVGKKLKVVATRPPELLPNCYRRVHDGTVTSSIDWWPLTSNKKRMSILGPKFFDGLCCLKMRITLKPLFVTKDN